MLKLIDGKKKIEIRGFTILQLKIVKIIWSAILLQES